MGPGIGEMRVFPSIWGHWAGGESCLFPRRSNYMFRMLTNE